MVDCLQNAYKGTLYRMFIVNATTLLKFLWGIIANFMDPNTKAKMQVFSTNNPKELTSLMMPSQLLKEYGGEADPPETYWPPVFPPVFREELETKHLKEEEFKKVLLTKAQMMPSPDLAQFVRNSRKGKGKKGIFPRKAYRLGGRLERRDSFNGIIGDEKPEVVGEKKVIETTPAIEERCSKPVKATPENNSHSDTDSAKAIIEEKKHQEEPRKEESRVEIRRTPKDDDQIDLKNDIRDCDNIKVELANNIQPVKEEVERAQPVKDNENAERLVDDSKRMRSMKLDSAEPGCKCIVF